MGNFRNHDDWMKRFERLAEFAFTHGHSAPARGYVTADGFKLGIWVSEQRKRRAKHAPQEVVALESLPGWIWNGDDWRSVRR